MRISTRGAVIGGAWVRGDIEVEEGILTRVGLPSTGRGSVVPTLVDLQVNGYGGVDFNAAGEDEARAALRALARDGVLHVQPTLITDSEENIAHRLGVLGGLEPRADEARIVGVHAEGPFLSPAHRGVHRPEYLRDPDFEIVRRMLAAGPLRTITVAPELPGARELIERAAAAGVIVQAGHSGADVDTANAGFNAGASAVTHLFNGMIAFGHRSPGIAGATLAREDIAIQLIADDIHLSPETSIFAVRAAEHRIMLVTDASSAAGAGDGTFTVGGFQITVTEGVPRLPDGTLAGSTVTLFEQVAKLVERGWALDRAVNLASRAPARFYGLGGVGELQIGRPANLIIADDELRITRVLRAGIEVAA
ncbi:N-acetylglucosamine-6-phosphate deacetylase [Mycetocola spongiae]|uniref:N-acetylglucosamine-6-phosphate deacetylase n=1 Tax=Mycetocola spongiae TaxID=2859226 RepID=UPI001CF17DD0|nr:N-acetylglucosamine-6-phosphate deacetylase [Mycetocola spongiae]UCR88065.1 N-acetylglucosamine-6-phosphate deacetylase [Mycetocola spongiae]